MDGTIHLYVAQGTATPDNLRFEAGARRGLLVFVNPTMVTSETQFAVLAERAGWTALELFQRGTISQALVEEKGDPHLSAWLDARHHGMAVIAYRETTGDATSI